MRPRAGRRSASVVGDAVADRAGDARPDAEIECRRAAATSRSTATGTGSPRPWTTCSSNALRHGAPPVHVSASTQDAGRVEIRVERPGAGCRRDDAGPAVRAVRHRPAQGGTGLGLFIVRELARAQGGDAFYERRPPERPAGAFVISLPVRGADRADVRAARARRTAIVGLGCDRAHPRPPGRRRRRTCAGWCARRCGSAAASRWSARPATAPRPSGSPSAPARRRRARPRACPTSPGARCSAASAAARRVEGRGLLRGRRRTDEPGSPSTSRATSLKDAELDYLVDLLESRRAAASAEATLDLPHDADAARARRGGSSPRRHRVGAASRSWTTRCWSRASSRPTPSRTPTRRAGIRLSLNRPGLRDRRDRHRRRHPGAAAGELHRRSTVAACAWSPR